MNIIIAGDGKVGDTIARQLANDGHSLTIIDTDNAVLEEIQERYDVMTVEGNCATIETLENAGVLTADLLIATAGADEINMLCCLTAHRINPRLKTIARIRNPEYSDQVYIMRDAFGLSMVVNPERQTATEIARLLRYPGFLRRDTFAKGRVELVELRISADSKLCNLPLHRLTAVIGCHILVCTILRDGHVITPDGNCVLEDGDRIFVTAPPQDLELLLKSLKIITRKAHRVMLAGGGRISYYLAQQLVRSNAEVLLLERNYERCRELEAKLRGVEIIHADVSINAQLDREGLSDCDALVTLSGLDELNMIVSMYGNTVNVPQVITKLGRMENGNMVRTLPLGSVVCPRELCCNNVVRYVRAMQNQTGAAVAIHAIADGMAEAIEFRADDSTRHCGVLLKNLKLKKGILVACIIRGITTEIPNGDSYIDKGDTIIIVSNRDHRIGHLNDIFA